MEPKRSSKIEYINQKAPRIERPAYRGQRYEAQVPDTLDPAEMAALAVNGITGPTDPEADYEIYWRVAFNTNPPVMWHHESDVVQGKFMEALPLLRLASGSEQNPHVEQRWMEVIRQLQGPDGLLYLPKIGRPWCIFGDYGAAPPGDHYTNPWFNGRLLGAMTIYHELTGDPEWLSRGGKIVEGFTQLIREEGKKASLPNHEFGTEGRYNSPAKPSDRIHNLATYASWAIQGLANFGRHAGHERAIELSGKLARFVIEDCNHFGPNGEFLEEYPGGGYIHFHGHTMVLLGILDYGLAANDREAIEFAHRGFRHGMSQGECLLGYFAAHLNKARPENLELCELADMIALALKLSAAGVDDYWDMADRWTRNLFYEGQLRPVHAHPLEWLSSRTATTMIAPVTLPEYHETDRVIERNIGAFGGWLSPNDWMPDYPHDLPEDDAGHHALLHGECDACDLLCLGERPESRRRAPPSQPALQPGLSVGRCRQPHPLSRAGGCAAQGAGPPGSAHPRVGRAGVEREIGFDGRYARVGSVDAGSSVTLTFPIGQRTETINVEKRTHRILLRGNTCVAVDPPGRNVPLFRRDHFLGNTRWHKTERFVPENLLAW